MPRKSSVILSAEQKKATILEIKQALKKHQADMAKLSADAKNATKAVSQTEKLQAKAVAEAKKAAEKTQARVSKMLAAAAKGRDKLSASLAEIEAAPVATDPSAAPKRRGRPPKVASVATPEPATV